jgi:hypothetical protein
MEEEAEEIAERIISSQPGAGLFSSMGDFFSTITSSIVYSLSIVGSLVIINGVFRFFNFSLKETAKNAVGKISIKKARLKSAIKKH